jgi:hypothetical protein
VRVAASNLRQDGAHLSREGLSRIGVGFRYGRRAFANLCRLHLANVGLHPHAGKIDDAKQRHSRLHHYPFSYAEFGNYTGNWRCEGEPRLRRAIALRALDDVVRNG